MGLYDGRFHVSRCMIFIEQGLGIWTQHILFTRDREEYEPICQVWVISKLFCFSGSYMFEIPMLGLLLTIWRHKHPTLFVFRILDPSATGLDTLSIGCRECGNKLTPQSSVATRFYQGPANLCKQNLITLCWPQAI